MMQSPQSKRVKLRFNSLLKRTQIPTSIEWAELREKVATMFELAKSEHVGVVYSDDENDLILVNSSIELWESFKIYESAPLIKYYVIYTEHEAVPIVMKRLETLRRKDTNVTSFFTNNLLGQSMSRNMTILAQSAIRHLPDETMNALNLNFREDRSLLDLVENLNAKATKELREEKEDTMTSSDPKLMKTSAQEAEEVRTSPGVSSTVTSTKEIVESEDLKRSQKDDVAETPSLVLEKDPQDLSIRKCELTQSSGSTGDDHSSVIGDDAEDPSKKVLQSDYFAAEEQKSFVEAAETENPEENKNEVLALSYDEDAQSEGTKIKVTPLDNIKWDNFDIRSLVNSTGPGLVQSIISSTRAVGGTIVKMGQKGNDTSLVVSPEETGVESSQQDVLRAPMVDDESKKQGNEIDDDEYDITLIKEESCISEFEGEEAIYNRYSFVKKK